MRIQRKPPRLSHLRTCSHGQQDANRTCENRRKGRLKAFEAIWQQQASGSSVPAVALDNLRRPCLLLWGFTGTLARREPQ